MTVVYATAAIIGALGLATIIGLFVAKRLDKKYGTEKTGK
ncbi:hypothetical protein SAMN05216217_110106 [Halopseudomonas yangmingensis]|uniref:Uncharacterized protein n=1 Tax=Halopseudomonas yangmingensis TaxID=1720063 RepID=A0A1I4SLX3_9GAMM|nr:hypothetical protein SAMN05216217_110106 [Halopseudomonas yangmingensis]